MLPASPKCPTCEIIGIEHIISNIDHHLFGIAHCSNCGHIHGTFHKSTVIEMKDSKDFSHNKPQSIHGTPINP